MLSIVKREDLIHEILIDNNEVSELRILKLPKNWWHTTISHDLEKSKDTLKLIKLKQQPKKKILLPSLPGTDYWDVRRGDYKVKESSCKKVQHSPEFKKVITFTHFSLTVVLTIATVVVILSQIAKV